MVMMPRTEAEVADAVRAARADGRPLSIEGGGTRRGLGRPSQTADVLNLSRLSGVKLYEPSEMVIGAWAGTPLSEVERTLAAKGQMLAFEPMDHRPLYGTAGEPTIGAVAAANISGPRRVYAGACRDSLIGVRFVNGDGQIIKSGGRVMKNVTGLDLVKLHCGAMGTLGVLTEVIFKVIPRPPGEATLIFPGLDDSRAISLMTAAMGTPFEVTGAAHWPAGLGHPTARTLLRLEGFPEQINYRSNALRDRFRPFGAADLHHGGDDGYGALWPTVRDALALVEPRDATLWRLSVPPTRGAEAVRMLGEGSGRRLYDWSGGLVWLATERPAAEVHAAATACGGHALMVRGADPLRVAEPVFPPLPEAVMALQRSIKASHDPAGVLNPGRMTQGL